MSYKYGTWGVDLWGLFFNKQMKDNNSGDLIVPSTSCLAFDADNKNIKQTEKPMH